MGFRPFYWWLIGSGLVASGACSGSTSPGAVACETSFDCGTGTVCGFGQCRSPCEKASECGVGQWCVADEFEAVCVSRDATCTAQAECPAPLVCATDYRCRNECDRNADCNELGTSGRVCVRDAHGVGVCAAPVEASSGSLDAEPAPGADGERIDYPSGYDDPGVSVGGGLVVPTGGVSGSGVGGKGGVGSGGTSPAGATSGAAAGTHSGGGGAANSGGAGAGGVGGSAGGPSVCDGKTYTLPLSEGYIDNFETNTRFAGWYAFSDTSPPNEPTPTFWPAGALQTAGAGYFTATAIKSSKQMGYGAGFGFGLVDPAKSACVDVSAFDGISFWAKGNVPGGTLTFQIIAHESQPSNAQPQGDCASPTGGCRFKHPAITVPFSGPWEHQVIRFEDLESPAFTWTDRRILGMSFITDGPAYYAWIDEVTFFKGTAPDGPVQSAEAGAGGSP